ncbi:AP2 domain family protein [Babesia bovis T2Bo]|uniref:AP2/ERF domain-containing protein n=1 Tax=Babesia bovis TaxID=5865 RepID=A7AWT1_BABBO|nr:AP2 domain family protein [Babesia bovis T2Bo]EDO05509.1 AP2 domain family protein [Babesia bovis T2Bo]|eukprot:XP_001609077.1 hypothetical protein [Babesia bovis T2Bo]
MLSASVFHPVEGIGHRPGCVPLMNDFPEMCYMPQFHDMGASTNSYTDFNGGPMDTEAVLWDRRVWDQGQYPGPSDLYNSYDTQIGFVNTDRIVPVEMLAEYAQYHERVSAQQQKALEIQHQLQQMHAQYTQYQAFLTNFHLPHIMEMELKGKYGLGDQGSRGVMGNVFGGNSSPTTHFHTMGQMSETLRELPYTFFADDNTAPCSPDRHSSSISSETTPNNMDVLNGISGYRAFPQKHNHGYNSTLDSVDMVTKPVVSLCSMASVSTVDLMNDEGYRSMGNGLATDDSDNTFDFTRKRTLSIDDPVDSALIIGSDEKRQKPTGPSDVSLVPDSYRVKYISNGNRAVKTPAFRRSGANDYPVKMPSSEPHYSRIPFSGPNAFMTEPIIDGQINHDYYRRDFYSRMSQHGLDHLFPEHNISCNPVRMGCEPLFNNVNGISCSAGATHDHKEVRSTNLDNISITPRRNIDDDLVNGNLRYPGDSNDEHDLTSEISPFGHDHTDLCDTQDQDSLSPKERKSHRLAAKKLSSNVFKVRKKIARSSEVIREHREIAQRLKSLEVGGIMVIKKRRSHRDSQIEIKKSTDFYDYLLDIPVTAEPDPELGVQQYKCLVPGVYWDKRSWIASWYENGIRCYSSFSAKMHGFYKAKYFAIHVRIFKTKNADFYDPEAETERYHILSQLGVKKC